MTPTAEPTDLPPHEILGETGNGPLGTVYRARDAVAGSVVALHAIRDDALTAEHLAAFFQEMRAAACLDHPHLLPILAVGLREGRPCYTTAFAPGGRLSERRAQFADPRAAAGLIEKAARAAAAAHAHGLLHGLLRPSEILFDDNDEPRVGGFGLLPFFRSAGTAAGVPTVLIEPAVDVRALGAILYELLVGRPPDDAPTPLQRLRRDVPPELEAVVLCALQPRVEDRYPSARALADDLERWLRAEPTVARPAPWWRRALDGLGRRLRRGAP